MGILYPAAEITACAGVFTVFAKHGLDMKNKKNYREMWGAWALSVTPAALFCLLAASAEIATPMGRNIVVIPVGAILGGCLFAYAGYVIHDFTATAAQVEPTATGASLIDGSKFAQNTIQPPITNNQGIITNNQSGGTNQIFNQEVPARIELVEPRTKVKLDSGQFNFSYKINITKTVPRFTLQAQGNNVTDIDIEQDGQTSVLFNMIQSYFRTDSGLLVHQNLSARHWADML